MRGASVSLVAGAAAIGYFITLVGGDFRVQVPGFEAIGPGRQDAKAQSRSRERQPQLKHRSPYLAIPSPENSVPRASDFQSVPAKRHPDLRYDR